MVAKTVLCLVGACSAAAYVPTAAPVRAPVVRSASPVMAADGVSTRRAMLASALLLAPAAANAMIVPGLNAPGLVPAKKLGSQGRSVKNEAWASIRDSSNFWSPKGVRPRLALPGRPPPPRLRDPPAASRSGPLLAAGTLRACCVSHLQTQPICTATWRLRVPPTGCAAARAPAPACLAPSSATRPSSPAELASV